MDPNDSMSDRGTTPPLRIISCSYSRGNLAATQAAYRRSGGSHPTPQRTAHVAQFGASGKTMSRSNATGWPQITQVP
jgi:hypothetical protein